MKIRNDYVSNSSSSSFIIISSNGTDETKYISKQFMEYQGSWCAYEFPNDRYKYEFGWEKEITNDFGGKLNFVGIQLLELLSMKINGVEPWGDIDPNKFDEYYDMVRDVCKEEFGFECKLNMDKLRTELCNGDDGYKIEVSVDGCYIDHQSCVTEGSCMEMFESKSAMIDFLRFKESYIDGGNDNC